MSSASSSMFTSSMFLGEGYDVVKKVEEGRRAMSCLCYTLLYEGSEMERKRGGADFHMFVLYVLYMYVKDVRWYRKKVMCGFPYGVYVHVVQVVNDGDEMVKKEDEVRCDVRCPCIRRTFCI